MRKVIEIFPNIEELNNFAAERFIEIGTEAIENRGQFTVALAGGSTPKSLYGLLATDTFKDKIDWNFVYFFFGDERNVLPDSAESNFRMANENLFTPLKIAETNIFRWKTEIETAAEISADYSEKISNFFKSKLKPIIAAEDSDRAGAHIRFDLILLGMGADGHLASLFPFTEALRETEKIAVANYVEKLEAMRFTLTFPTINNARNIMFLIKSADKAETLRHVLEGEFEPDKLPSQNVKPVSGNLFWLCDAESAAKLKKIGA